MKNYILNEGYPNTKIFFEKAFKDKIYEKKRYLLIYQTVLEVYYWVIITVILIDLLESTLIKK